jgi:hypothetical protein
MLSPLTSHLSPFTSHLSSLTSHLSPLTFHLSPLTSYLSPLTSAFHHTSVIPSAANRDPRAELVRLVGHVADAVMARIRVHDKVVEALMNGTLGAGEARSLVTFYAGCVFTPTAILIQNTTGYLFDGFLDVGIHDHNLQRAISPLGTLCVVKTFASHADAHKELNAYAQLHAGHPTPCPFLCQPIEVIPLPHRNVGVSAPPFQVALSSSLSPFSSPSSPSSSTSPSSCSPSPPPSPPLSPHGLVLPELGTSIRALLSSTVGANGMTRFQAAGPLVSALCVMLAAHMNCLCFGDLKPDNMCISGAGTAVVDAGSTVAFGHPITSASVEYYLQEELIASARFDRVCFASTAYHLVMGSPPPTSSYIYNPLREMPVARRLAPLGSAPPPSTPRSRLVQVIESSLDDTLSVLDLIGVVIREFQPKQAAVAKQLDYVFARVLDGTLLPAAVWGIVLEY